MAQTEQNNTPKLNKQPFFKMSQKDSDWLEYEPISVWKLWHHAAHSDPWGDCKWYTLYTTVESSAFKRARLKLQEYGAFKFRPMRGESTGDYRRIEGWEVKNLHGGRSDYYTEYDEEDQ